MNKTLLFRSIWSLAALLATGSAALADFNPVPLTPGTFTFDVVVEKTASQPMSDYTTATMDGGTNNDSAVWFEQGFDSTRPTTGLPPANSSFAAQADSNRTFKMPPSYSAPNALLLTTSGHPSGTLTFSTPTAAAVLSVLGSVSGGPMTVNYTVHHQGGADETGTISVPDWFNVAANIAWVANGRVNVGSGQTDNQYGNNPRLYYTDIFLTDAVNPVTSVDFSTASGSRAALFGISSSTDNLNYVPVTVTGFNRDMVVEATAPITGSLYTKNNVIMDSGATNLTGNTWYEIGFNKAAPTTGLPAAGSNVSGGTPLHTFTMPSSYTANDVLYIGNYAGYTTGTFTLSTPTTFTGLSLLNAAGNGPANVTVTIHFADTSVEAYSIAIADWFNGSAAFYAVNGRFNPSSLALNDVNSGNPRLRTNDITLVNTASPVTSIDFTYVSGGRAMIFGVAGQTSGGGAYSPVAVTGFNADGVVEASAFRFPNPLYTATTATMDGGTNFTGGNNNLNTWYEQGYFRYRPQTGLPPAGSTIDSIALPDHHYQLPATYTGNNAVYVDSKFTNVNLTIATPAAYSALSFLSTCANGRVTNACIMQYADGTTETNTFISQDWFNNSLPYAFAAGGRTDVNRRTVNNVGTTFPRLFEAQFPLGNTVVPVTNIVIQYLGSENATSGRMFIFAVSGTAGAVPPIISAVSPTALTTVEGSNVVISATVTGGTEPITYQWQARALGGGTFTNISDGGNTSGVTTTNLTFTGIGWTNAADYRLVATNAAGFGVGPISSITVLSGLPDVTKPGDPISLIAGSTPGAEGVANYINNTFAKCLNWDADAVTPFVGPVGFVVTPSVGSSVISVLRIYTANDAENRDPADVSVEGSNDDGANWTLISSNSLALPAGRNTVLTDVPNPLVNFMREVRFSNSTGYKSYRVSFFNIKNNNAEAGMQIGEIELLGVLSPVPPAIVRQPTSSVKVWAGASPTFSVVAAGQSPLAYQWYRDGSILIPDATNAAYTFPNAQLADSGKTFSCTVTNIYGPTSSASATLFVVAPPTQTYPTAVLADNPVSYFRLGEGPDDGLGNNGQIANDYRGGHVGVYSNTIVGVTGYNSTSDSDTAAQFGVYATSDSYVGAIHDLTFAATNASVAFSIETWVNGPANQTAGAGILAKGTGGGGEQFDLDCGGAGTAFRFLIRDAAGAGHLVNSTNVADGAWHHLVGVCDEANGVMALYVDGISRGTTSLTPGSGLLATAAPVTIGARQGGGVGTVFNNQFNGVVDEVVIYDHALSPAQVLNHYYAAEYPPVVLVGPTNTVANEGSTATFYTSAYGPGTLTYKWYDVTAGDPGVLMDGQTSSNLVLANVTAAQNGKLFRVEVSNAYGSVLSPTLLEAAAQLTVVEGFPFIATDLPSKLLVYAGRTATLSVVANGSEPLSYQWTSNGVNLVDGGRVTGSHTNTLKIANAQLSDAATYQVSITNTVGGPAISTATALTVVTVPSLNSDGTGWGLNGTPAPATVTDDVLSLTSGNGNTARSAFFSYPLYIGGFTASFVYQDVGGGGADGMAFVLQNDPRGATALGGGGGGLGYSGITPSVAQEFNIYGPNTVGTAFRTNGVTGGPYVPTTPVDISSGEKIQVKLTYGAGVLQLALSNMVSGVTYTTNQTVGDLPTLLGADTAYVGLTGADGGTASSQQVSNFSFIPVPLLTATASANSVVLTWPASIGGYNLQFTTDLATAWANDTTPVTQVGGQNQVVISPLTGIRFYRLHLSVP